MKTFAERLKIAIEKIGISQTEAARRCGISQQSINYMILNNLKQSKLAANIAASLNINPDWLIYGEGRFKETKYYEVPIIDSAYKILKYIHNDLDKDTCPSIVIDIYLGNIAFAYLFEPNKLAICCEKEYNFEPMEYLCIAGTAVKIEKQSTLDLAFSIIEWRIRSVGFQFPSI